MNLKTQNSNVKTQMYDNEMHKTLKSPHDKRIISELNMLIAGVTADIERYRLSDSAQKIYEFAWHRLADVHLEKNKERFKEGDPQALAVLLHVYTTILTLLHPFMPFVTEAIWTELKSLRYNPNEPLITAPWPI